MNVVNVIVRVSNKVSLLIVYWCIEICMYAEMT